MGKPLVPDPGYCNHGRSMHDRCVFCGREGAPGKLKAQPAEHRNPPATPDRRAFERGRRGGQATAAKRKRERGEEILWKDL